MLIALIDGDVLVYRIGFACQKKKYKVMWTDIGMSFTCDTEKEALKLLGDKEGEGYIKTITDVLDQKTVVRMLKNQIDSIVKNSKSTGHKIFLTGSGNFREDVAISYPYKGNRKADKPKHYSFIRDYIMNELRGIIVTGQEADDVLAIEQMKDVKNTVICSIDKDLLMCPGKHYNIGTQRSLRATDPGDIKLEKKKLTGYGFKWFCCQMLLGDNVDNIKGIRGLGDVRVHKLMVSRYTVKTMWLRVRAVYRMKGLSRERLEENALLLWIRREDGQHPYDWIEENT